jgi:hypothetical protein
LDIHRIFVGFHFPESLDDLVQGFDAFTELPSPSHRGLLLSEGRKVAALHFLGLNLESFLEFIAIFSAVLQKRGVDVVEGVEVLKCCPGPALIGVHPQCKLAVGASEFQI